MAGKFTLANAQNAIRLAQNLEEINRKISDMENVGIVHIVIYDQEERVAFGHRERPYDDPIAASAVANMIAEYRRQRDLILDQMNAIGFEVPS